MTDKDFLKTLGTSEQRLVRKLRAALNDHAPQAAILLGGQVVTTDVIVASLWWAHHHDDARVGHDHVGDVLVSTVFLPTPHCGDGPGDYHFETMTFAHQSARTEDRYQTLADARVGHRRVCQQYRSRVIRP